MSDAFSPSLSRPEIPGFTPAPAQVPGNRHVEAALERHKREGMDLAVKTRTVAMSIIIVMLIFLTPWPLLLFYQGTALLFILNGLAQKKIASVGRSRPELILLFMDLALMTVICVVTPPFQTESWPAPVRYEFNVFIYFFVLLSGATLAYSWRTLIAVGVWTALLWTGGAVVIWLMTEPHPVISSALDRLYADMPRMRELYDPTRMQWDIRIQETVVFLMVAGILAVSVRRSSNLVLRQAEAARERANLARYFSPNVVEQLSQNDDPLKKVRNQEIAVMFVDIVGFTRYAAAQPPETVIETLREFQARMEAEVFRHDGTLDKYLGDGLMATFGTPVAAPDDARNALLAARAMLASSDAWNAERRAAGKEEITVSIGLDFGPVVLGDIGGNRLEFAVIGNTVNRASRIEAMTRKLGVRLAVSDDLMQQLGAGDAAATEDTLDLARHDDQELRGFDRKISVWCLG